MWCFLQFIREIIVDTAMVLPGLDSRVIIQNCLFIVEGALKGTIRRMPIVNVVVKEDESKEGQ